MRALQGAVGPAAQDRTLALHDCAPVNADLARRYPQAELLRVPDGLQAACALAQNLEGMQPSNRQVPPSPAPFSTRRMLRPDPASAMAAGVPPGPPPMTNTSIVSMRP